MSYLYSHSQTTSQHYTVSCSNLKHDKYIFILHIQYMNIIYHTNNIMMKILIIIMIKINNV